MARGVDPARPDLRTALSVCTFIPNRRSEERTGFTVDVFSATNSSLKDFGSWKGSVIFSYPGRKTLEYVCAAADDLLRRSVMITAGVRVSIRRVIPMNRKEDFRQLKKNVYTTFPTLLGPPQIYSSLYTVIIDSLSGPQ